MASKAQELAPERVKSLRTFKFVVGAFFVGMTLGTYVEKNHILNEGEAHHLWRYMQGKAVSYVGGFVESGNLPSNETMFIFKKAEKWLDNVHSVQHYIDTNYPLSGERMRASFWRLLLLWSGACAALAYIGISVLEEREK